ncbi:MAG: PSP1 C-terminal domain-containing protein [Planctomycetota bacterium]
MGNAKSQKVSHWSPTSTSTIGVFPILLINLQDSMITIAPHHLVRVGILGHIGRFHASDGLHYRRGTRVICRTNRGLELGEVLSHVTPASTQCSGDGTLVRALTAEDELLLVRQEKNRVEAYQACEQLLKEHKVSAALLDVESLFDGGTLYFYFLGKIPDDVQPLVDELAVAYESQVKFREFAEAVEVGCGPDCGTENASGCGEGGCESCAIAAACRTKS